MTPNLSPSSNSQPRSDRLILVVDDDPVICEVVRAMLAGSGRNSLCAATAEEATRLAGDPANRVGVILADLILPNVLGLSLFETLRQVAPAAVLVAMTGLAGSLSAADLAAAGIRGVLAKPFTATQLVDAVADAGG